MRRGLLVIALAACGSDSGSPTGSPFLDDRAFRRGELEASLVNPDNDYSRLRLDNYATPRGGWDALPEWNPDLDVDIDSLDPDALRALGEQAFFQYPMMPLPAAAAPLANAGYGVDRLQHTSLGLAATCSTCHAAVKDGVLVPGLANASIDVGRLYADAGALQSSQVPWYRAWGPGRVDVTTFAGTEPVRIPDLRAIKWLTFLQADATVRQLDLTSLAIRIDTLIITSHNAERRPPRIISLALATYLWSLADTVPADAPSGVRGADIFASRCAGCHVPPALTGAPVPLDAIGTDPTLGLSQVRGTGTYRVPSLHGVGARGLLFHDGAVRSLADLLDPARRSPSYSGGVRPGAVPGHDAGLDLDAASRADLIAYLNTL